jgi:hypothetical protein|tara:strand:- start:165 stop:464 length:300 start_codon:yes stop_codon:yes gene_type:complete
MVERWITNLESKEALASSVEFIEGRVAKATPETLKSVQHELHVAKYKQADVLRTYEQINLETAGRFTIGEPKATPARTSADIAARGIVGIFREGAGTGS